MYALVDANNFYVSCERVFRPALRTMPPYPVVVVCVVVFLIAALAGVLLNFKWE